MSGLAGYLLLARFNVANQGYADTQVLGPPEGVNIGQLTVVEVDGALSVVANECAFTAQGTPVWTDLGFPSQAITKALGRGLLVIVNLSTWEELGIGWDSVATVDDPDNFTYALQANATDGQIDVEGGTTIYTGLSTSTDYRWCLLLGGYDVNGTPYYSGQTKADYVYGCWYLVEMGSTWHLVWTKMTDNTATLYALFANLDGVGILDDIVVPDSDLSAVQAAVTNFSSFAAANGTDLATGYTPEVGADWVEQSGDWDIQGNRANPDGAAVATIDSGISDILEDCIVQVGTNDSGIIMRYSDATHFWLLSLNAAGNEIALWENDAGFVKRASTGVALVAGVDYDARVIADGQTIDGFVDGGDKISYGSAALNESATIHGMRATHTNDQFDNFAVSPRTAAIYNSTLGAV